VFDPFFTTKEVGRGTGLGLSQVYGCARQCGGMATIDSEPGRGTTLTLYLPRAVARAPLPAVPAVAARPAPAPGDMVLLVEDNDAVADVAAMMLDGIGYRVHRVASAQAALAFVAEAQRPPALVLSDIVMPGGLDGLDLGRQLREQHPALPLVLTTGYSTAAQDAVTEGYVVLPKPYAPRALEQAMATALSQVTRGPA
jgi:two-component system NtrC family sensor kinase